VERRLSEVCTKITDGTHSSPKNQLTTRQDNTYMYITSKNIRNNKIDISDITYVDKQFHDNVYSRCTPELGDVLFTKDGSNTGNVTLNTIDEPFTLLSSVCLIKTIPSLLTSAYLCFYLQSSIGQHRILGSMSGTAIRRIVLRDIKEAIIPMPDLETQKTIVNQISLILGEKDRLTAIYERKVAALAELKQSLLAEVFGA